MAEIIAASHDVMFKALFVRNKSLLRAFLRDVLDLPLTESDKIEILNPELIPEATEGKLSRLDIHVETANRRFNVEMQARKNGFSPERVLYYWSKMFADKIESGKKYKDLQQTYSINVLGFRFSDCEEYYSSYSIREDKRHELFTDKLSIHIFELPKVPKELVTGDTKQQWMELIKADSKEALEMVRTSTSSPDIRQGIETIYELNADVALREQILARDKAVRDYENDMATARDEGEAIGEARGVAKGRAEGEAKGRMEAMLDMARNLLHMRSMSEKDIATATNLPLETIQKLAAQA